MVLIGMNGSELVLNGFQGQITLKKIPHLKKIGVT